MIEDDWAAIGAEDEVWPEIDAGEEPRPGVRSPGDAAGDGPGGRSPGAAERDGPGGPRSPGDAAGDGPRPDGHRALSVGPAIEAILMVSAEPVPAQLLAELLETAIEQVEASIERLRADYESEGRGFVLAKVAGGYRYQSHPDQAAFVERFATDGQPSRLSPAALETLAIVAYLQPVSRAQISAIRGVGVDGVVRMLCQRGYLATVGRDPGPGQAVLFGTTASFLERMGLDEIGSLPPLGDFVPGSEVMEALEEGLAER